MNQAIDRFNRNTFFQRRVARIVVNVAGVVGAVHANPFFGQIVMNIHHSAARENGFKVVFLQLMQAGAAAHQNRGDVRIVERIGNTVEEHAITRHDIVAFFTQSVALLRVAAAAVTRRKDDLHAHVIKHSQYCNRDLTKELFITAAGEIEHGLPSGLGTDNLLVLDHRDVSRLFNVEQTARRGMNFVFRELSVH